MLSDGSITVIVTGCVTVVTTLIAFLTVWLKLKYNGEKADAVERKVDENTAITTEAKDAASKASEHSDDCDKERKWILESIQQHGSRLNALEIQMASLSSSLANLLKGVDSTRHEMRGHLQTLTTKLDIIMGLPKEGAK